MSKSKKKYEDYSMTVGGQTIKCPVNMIPYDKVRLDPRNPRYRNHVESSSGGVTEADMRTKLNKEGDTRDLSLSIKHNGLIEPIFVLACTEGNYLTIEGNRRNVAWGQLREEAVKADDKSKDFSEIPAFVIPPSVTPAQLRLWLGLKHGSLALTWSKLARAMHIAEIVTLDYGGDTATVARLLGLKRGEVDDMVRSVALCDEYQKQTGKTDADDKYYTCFEFGRLRTTISEDDKIKKQFFSALADNKIGKSQNVRQIPDLIEDKAAWKSLVESEPTTSKKKKGDPAAWTNAINVLKESSPESIKGGPVQMMEKLQLILDTKQGDSVKALTTKIGSRVFMGLLTTMFEIADLASMMDEVKKKIKIK